MTVALLVLIGVASAAVVIWPLRSGAAERDALAAQVRRADLVAEKEARYREIRDAELDRETGKVSAEDWRRIDRELRADAARILEELDKT
ncbi:MAG: hypothetical protein V9E83_01605 [Baekduia sp.]